MELPEIKKKIGEFLNERMPGITLKGEQLFFAGDEMSSIELVEMAVELEHEFGVRFRLAEITEQNFRTLEMIAALIARSGKK